MRSHLVRSSRGDHRVSVLETFMKKVKPPKMPKHYRAGLAQRAVAPNLGQAHDARYLAYMVVYALSQNDEEHSA